MNTGRSIKIQLARHDRSVQWLADQLGLTRPHVSTLIGQKHCSGKVLERLAEIFDMSVSEFVAEGEEETKSA